MHRRNEILDAIETEWGTYVPTVPLEVQEVTTPDKENTPVVRLHLGDDNPAELAGSTDGFARSQRIDFVYLAYGSDRRALSTAAGEVDDQIWSMLTAENSLDALIMTSTSSCCSKNPTIGCSSRPSVTCSSTRNRRLPWVPRQSPAAI